MQVLCQVFAYLTSLTVLFFLSVEDLMAGKRVYMTASTAREHTIKLWQNEGKACKEEKKIAQNEAKKKKTDAKFKKLETYI